MRIAANKSYNRTPLRILIIQFECSSWDKGTSYPYCLNFALEESLRANGAEVFLLKTPWLRQLPKLVAGKIFDQVWLNDLSHFADIDLDLSFIRDLAPTRVGFITESVEYSSQDYATFPWLPYRRSRLDKQFQFLTHLLAVDEFDVANLKARFGLPTLWIPCSIPERWICHQVSPPQQHKAFFSGSLYGERESWLQDPRLSRMLKRNQLINADRICSFFFNRLPGHKFGLPVSSSIFPASMIYPLYLNALRCIRASAFLAWQKNVLQQGVAVVNLPHLVKGYSSRVIEGIAAGRPVISWKIPDRPLNTALFEDGKEILLYSTPEELADHIEKILSEPDFARQIAENATYKVKQWHTSETRVEQILNWLDNNDAPTYGISMSSL